MAVKLDEGKPRHESGLAISRLLDLVASSMMLNGGNSLRGYGDGRALLPPSSESAGVRSPSVEALSPDIMECERMACISSRGGRSADPLARGVLLLFGPIGVRSTSLFRIAASGVSARLRSSASNSIRKGISGESSISISKGPIELDSLTVRRGFLSRFSLSSPSINQYS